MTVEYAISILGRWEVYSRVLKPEERFYLCKNRRDLDSIYTAYVVDREESGAEVVEEHQALPGDPLVEDHPDWEKWVNRQEIPAGTPMSTRGFLIRHHLRIF